MADPAALLRELDEFEAAQQKTPEQLLAELDAFEGVQKAPAPKPAVPSESLSMIRGNVDNRASQILQPGMSPAQMRNYAVDANGKALGLANKAAQGLPFVGEWLDDAQEYLNPGSGKYVRALQQGMDERHPVASTIAEVGGGIAGTIPMAAAGLGVAGGAKTAVGSVLRGIGLGATGGALEGASRGAGANQQDRLRGAMSGGMLGGTIGAGVGAVAPLVMKGATALTRRVKGLDVRAIMDEFGLSPAAARTVREALENDDISTAAQRIGRLGDDAMLADAGDATGTLLDASTKTGGRALAVARKPVERRAAKQGKHLTRVLDDTLGKPQGIRASTKKIAQKSAGPRKEAYDLAYSQPIDYAEDSGRKIEGILDRINPKHLKEAVDEANAIMRDEGIVNRQIMATIADDGTVSFQKMPDVLQLDKLKQGLQSVVDSGTDSVTGRMSDAARRASRQAADLRDALAEAVPEYRRAVRLGGDKIAEQNGLEMGRKLLSRGTTFEDAAGVLRGAAKDVKEAAKRGLRENIENTLSNVRRTITDSSTDAREAMQIIKDLSSRANKKKLRLVLGDQAETLLNEIDKSAAALELRGVIARNSDTAIRQAIQSNVKDEVAPGLVRRTLGRGGNPLEAAREITETVAAIDPKSMSRAERQIFAEISEALTSIRGPRAQQAISIVEQAMRGQPIKDEQARLIGRLVASTMAGGGYQAAQQKIAP